MGPVSLKYGQVGARGMITAFPHQERFSLQFCFSCCKRYGSFAQNEVATLRFHNKTRALLLILLGGFSFLKKKLLVKESFEIIVEKEHCCIQNKLMLPKLEEMFLQRTSVINIVW